MTNNEKTQPRNTKSLKHKLAGLLRGIFSPSSMMLVMPLALLVPNIALCFTEFNSVWAKLCNVALPLGVYLLLMSLSRKVGHSILWFIPLMVFCAFQIVLLYLYGESIIAVDMFLNVATTNFGEATELLGNLKIAIATVLIVYLPCIIRGIVLTVKHKRASERSVRITRRLGLGSLAAGLAFLACAYIFAPGYRISRELFPYNILDNLVTAVQRGVESSHYSDTSRNFSYRARSEHPADSTEVYVVVIGETSRADNWQLFGYERETNPRLSRRRGLIAMPRTLSEINTTHKSVPMLMSYLHSENFGDSVAHTRSVFEAFNTAGYSTVFISNQRRNGSYIDFYGEEAARHIFLTDNGPMRPDLDMIAELNKAIAEAKTKKVFIVLHTYGSHFEYRKRYPADMAHFRPEKNTEASFMNRPQLINAYDNTIRYTDLMLDSVITNLERLGAPAAMLYVSDHGEDIFDDARGRFLHASPVATYWQLHVPFVIWTSEAYRREYPGVVKAMEQNAAKNVSSSRTLFHTLMDISGLRTPYYEPSSSLASPAYCEPARRYLNDYNESVPLDRSGLRPSDLDQLRHHGLSAQ